MNTQHARPYDRPMFDMPGSLVAPAVHRRRTPTSRIHDHPMAVAPLPGEAGLQQLVFEFHVAFGLPRADRPTMDVTDDLAALRNALLKEESAELITACEQRDLVAIADGIADVLYVVFGTAVTYGLDAASLVREVHRSNMSKLGPDGLPILREDGKVIKGPNYSRPDFKSLLLDTSH